MEVIEYPDAETAAVQAAQQIAGLLQRKPNAVLGLATGSTPVRLYAELIRLHQTDGLDFREVTTFNLDEYLGLHPDHPQTFRNWMHAHFFSQVNLRPERTHVLDSMTRDVEQTCAAYENAIADAGGIDLQILGIGRNGHIGFNEPSSSLASRTRIKTLTPQTLKDNARFFGGDPANVPTHCLTMGIGTILDAHRIMMLAFGDAKAAAVAAAVEGPLSAAQPASALQLHPHTQLYLDPPAAARLQHRETYRWVFEHKPIPAS